MGDLISQEALKKNLQYVYSCAYIESKSKEGIVSDIIDTIDNAPTVEERPQGEWIDTGDMEEYWAEEYQCSICGVKNHWHNFCPYCGAKMTGNKEADK